MGPENKMTTVPDPSVGAGGGQPFFNDTKDRIAEEGTSFKDDMAILYDLYRMERENDPSYLRTITMNQLLDEVYHSGPSVIDGLLYAGTYILAGAPKVGKSFLVAQLAYHVSTGQSLWNCDVRQGRVLYLALEDGNRRLQERMFRMFGVNGTDRLHFSTHADTVENGLMEQLNHFLTDYPDTRLVIIDTLQKVRSNKTEGYSYAGDYEVIGKLKQFADQRGICLLIVHHTRKQQADDKFEMISGTTGLLGCADGAFLLQKANRTDLNATLDIVGRDQPDQRLYLMRDEDTLAWNLDHTERDVRKQPTDPELEAAAKLVSSERREWRGTPSELAEIIGTGMAANALTRHLNASASRLRDEYRVRYTNRHCHEGRQITLTYLPVEVPDREVIV